jgi:hypothetical protein
MKLKKIHTSHLRNDAYFQFHTEFRDLVTRHGAKTLKIEERFNELYLPLYGKLDDVLKKIRKSALTDKILEADAARDDMCAGIYEISRAYLRHFDEDTRDAAKRLKILFDTYGNITKKPLNEQTSAVYNLLQELEGKYAQDAQKIKIDEWVSKLKWSNENFESIVKERFDESGSKTNVAVKDVRKDLDEVYKSLRDMINVFQMLDTSNSYDPFINTFNAVVAKYNTTSGRKSGSTQPTEIPEEAPIA